MLPCSMVLCGELEEEEGGKAALIDQRAVAAGKNILKLLLKISFYSSYCYRIEGEIDLGFPYLLEANYKGGPGC